MQNKFWGNIRRLIIGMSVLIAPIVILVATAGNASAYVLLEDRCRGGQEQDQCLRKGSLSFIFILDEISDDENQFFTRLDELWPAGTKLPIVFLESHGGKSRDAYIVGRVLRKRQGIVATGNPFTGVDRFECDSACSMLALGAVERHLKQVGLHSGHLVLNGCEKNEKSVPVKPEDDQKLLDYLEEMGADPRILKIIKETPYDQLTDLIFEADQPAESQLITQLGYHMDSTPDFPRDGLRKAAIHREKSHEQVLRYAADMGNNEAVLALADYFMCDGPKRTPNPKAAADALKIGNQRGFHGASYRLAQLFEQGQLGRHHLNDAINIYRENAAFGDGKSGFRLGWLFLKGHGVKRDTTKALYWLNQAAKNGSYESYGALCKIHFTGKLVKRDDIISYKWCDLAIATLDEGRMKRDAIRYMHRLADRMTDADIDKACTEETAYESYARRQHS